MVPKSFQGLKPPKKVFVREGCVALLPIMKRFHLLPNILYRVFKMDWQMTFYKVFFAALLIYDAFRSPIHKTCFSFSLKCIQNLHFPIYFGRFSPVSTQPHQNGREKCKSCGHPRAKLKHVLWLRYLKASYINGAAKKTLQNVIYLCFQNNCT